MSYVLALGDGRCYDRDELQPEEPMQPSEKEFERLSGELKDLPLAEPVDATDEAQQVKGGAEAQEIVSPRDAASGLPTGKRQHGPL